MLSDKVQHNKTKEKTEDESVDLLLRPSEVGNEYPSRRALGQDSSSTLSNLRDIKTGVLLERLYFRE